MQAVSFGISYIYGVFNINNMKKVFNLLGSTGALLCLGVMYSTAQQLPNVGFEDWKTTCGETWQTASSTSFTRPGIEPAEWNGSNVKQFLSFDGFVTKGTGIDGSTSVKLTNQKPGFATLAAPAPAFITFATPWIFADMSKLNAAAIAMGDGGAYGGMEFTYRPDAITGYFKRDNSAGAENAHIIVYLWNGTYKSGVRSAITGSSSTGYTESATVELEDVDRAIMGKVTPTQSGKLIASCDYEITGSINEWTEITVPLQYVEENLSELPKKMNVILSSADYWTRSNIIPNNILEADNVKFLYYSQLESLSIDGVPLTGFDKDTYNYVVTGTCPTDASQITAVPDGKNATTQIECDPVAQTVTITVTNVGEDAEGNTSHTYTVQYETPVVFYYNGLLTINLDALGMETSHTYNIVEIIPTSETTCDFALRNFTFMGLSIGDIVVPDVVISENNGSKTYNGSVENLILGSGFMTLDCDVTVTGSEDAEGNMLMTINVLWYTDRASGTATPINVTFDGAAIAEGLRLTDVAVNGSTLEGFDKETFNYTGDAAAFATTATPLITYVKEDAESVVSVEINDYSVKLIVSKEGRHNFYSILDSDASFAGIELPATVEGNLNITGNKEIKGVKSVVGNITYQLDLSDREWNDISLPFTTASREVISTDGESKPLTDNIEWAALNGTEFVITDAETATTGIVSAIERTITSRDKLRFTSTTGWNTQESGNASQQGSYCLIGNPSLVSCAATDMTAATTYYILNGDGTKYIQSASPMIAPFATMIAYNGNAADALSEININISSGIDGINADNASIYATNGNIVINGYEGKVSIHLLNGAQVKSVYATGHRTLIPVKAGTYVVSTAGKGTLVVVK